MAFLGVRIGCRFSLRLCVRPFLFRLIRVKELEMECKLVPSVCSYCGTGCGVLFEVINGKIVSTLPMKTHPVNEGKLCIKGWNLHEHVNSFMRLKQPLVKTFGRFIKN